MTITNAIGYLASLLLGFALVLGAIILVGAVMSQLWAWFVVPLGVPAIGVLQATGIALVARLAVFQDCQQESKDKNYSRAHWLLTAYGTPSAFFLAGWLIHLCN